MPALPTLPHCILHTAKSTLGRTANSPLTNVAAHWSQEPVAALQHTASTAHWNQQSGRNRTLASGLCANLACSTPAHWQGAHCSSTSPHQHSSTAAAQWLESADAALAPALSAHKYKSFTKVEFLLSTKMREFEGIFSIAYIPPI